MLCGICKKGREYSNQNNQQGKLIRASGYVEHGAKKNGQEIITSYGVDDPHTA
jgi:hypothetical protein